MWCTDPQIISTVILGLSGLLISWFYSWRTSSREADKMMKELFTEFNQRYDRLNDSLVIIEANFRSVESFKQLEAKCNELEDGDKEKYKQLRQAVIDYFNLCAEEFYWYHHKKRIDPLVWKSWQAGMNYWYNEVPSIKALWMEEVKANGKASYYINDKVEFFKDKE